MAAAQSERTTKWWIPLVFGILSILLGIFFLVRPGTTTAVTVKFLGLYWLITGVITLYHMFTDRTAWGWKLFSGILGILAGLLVLFSDPLIAAIGVSWAFTFVLGLWGIFMGIVMLISAFQGGGWGPGIMGALAIILGIFLAWNPLAAALALPLVLGIFLIVGGIMNLFAAFRMK
jgi:uncharacterized membrane protein HdeD (DUF308 family)